MEYCKQFLLLGLLVATLALSAQAERLPADRIVATSLRFDGRAVLCSIKSKPSIPGALFKTDFRKLSTLFALRKKALNKSAKNKKKIASLKRTLDLAAKYCKGLSLPAPTARPSDPLPEPNTPVANTPAPASPVPQSTSLEHYDGAFSEAQARHLLRRTTYGPTSEEVKASIARGLDATIDWLLSESPTPQLDAEVEKLKDGDDDQDQDYITPEGARMVLLTYARKSPNQFKERMAMFWHDLFAASHRVLDWGETHFLFEYMDICRSEALGNAKRLATSMVTNGMMLTWLDGRLNRTGKINENFAREFWELFSLGIGKYSEHDVHESARALTGWTVVWRDESDRFEVAYVPSRRDNGSKVIFENTPYEQRGNFGAEDIIRLTYDTHPEAPRFLAKALYTFLVGSPPDETNLAILAARLKADNFEVKPVLRMILQSKAFFAGSAFFNKVRTPVTFLVSFFRTTGLPWDFWEVLEDLRSSGQDPLNPPSVKGWDDGQYWLNQQWLLTRMNVPSQAFNNASWRFDPFSYLTRSGMNPQSLDQILEQVADRLQVEIPPEALPKVKYYLNHSMNWEGKIEENVFDATDKDAIEIKIRGLIFILSQLPTFQRE